MAEGRVARVVCRAALVSLSNGLPVAKNLCFEK